jgi:predicted acyl esterase
MSAPATGIVQDVRIAMTDGVELAATLYLPDPADGPQPCILEALPYRKDDLTSSSAAEYTRLRDEHGYAVCRLDLRGTGSSGGDATDEYPLGERSDVAAVIAWLADQEWCDGAVGMYGTSYSGFNALQLACERPPALRAVVAIYASDDRWTDDVHWRGGQRKLVDLVDYCHYMTPMNALPPVPAAWGDGWRDEWLRRVRTTEPWLLRWLRERTDGAYWRHGSVAPDYTRIDVPVMLVAGWADGYRNNTFRTIEALRGAGVPHRLLAGPWAHAATDTALPGPRIDLVPEMAAWWDRWLRGRPVEVDDGLAGRPSSTLFVIRSTRPAPDLDTLDGTWVREQWPSPRVQVQRYPLPQRPPHPVRADTGVDAWIDCAGHLPWGQSSDQRFDDAASMRWDLPLGGSTVIGQPVLRLRVSADAPHAAVSAKLCDVFPDGTSRLVSRGSLDLAFRDSRTDPAPLEPGHTYDVDLVLDACAHELAPGHLLRLSVAGTDWPNVVAPRGPVTLTVDDSELDLPVWTGPSPHAPPQLVPGAEQAEETAADMVWRTERDVLRRETACLVDHGSTYDLPAGGSATEHYRGRVSVDTGTFVQRAEADVSFTLRRPDEPEVATRSRLDVVVDADAYDVRITLEATEDGVVVGERTWHERLPR